MTMACAPTVCTSVTSRRTLHVADRRNPIDPARELLQEAVTRWEVEGTYEFDAYHDWLEDWIARCKEVLEGDR
jgi:hypothetical protein